MKINPVIEAQELASSEEVVIVDCRFDLADPEAGWRAYCESHIPGARYLHLNRDLSAPVGEHGGRHPLPAPEDFIQTLAAIGIGPDTTVVAYDASRFAFAARLWWMLRSLGYRPPRLLNGGYQAWLDAGHEIESGEGPGRPAALAPAAQAFRQVCAKEHIAALQADGALLVDSREAPRYRGEMEPIDPVAGHIPGAVNHPWQGVTDDQGRLRDAEGLRAHLGDTLQSEQLVVYCGSGVTACVNLFALSCLGRDDPILYAGSWSDWCSYM